MRGRGKQESQGERDGTETAMAGSEGGRGLGAEEQARAPRPRGGKERGASLERPEGTWLCHLPDRFRTSGLQNCKIIHFCGSKLLNVWWFVKAANKYTAPPGRLLRKSLFCERDLPKIFFHS